MKLAYSTNAYRRYPVEEAIDRIAELGYTGIELMADVPHLWPATTHDAQICAVRNRLDARGLTISNLNAFMMNAVRDFWHPSWIEPDERLRRLRIDHTKSALRMAARLGALTITTEPGGPLPEGMDWFAALHLFVTGLSEALRVAEEVGVMLLVEPEPGLLIENASQFEELAEHLDSPMFGLNFDIGHFYCVSDPIPETIRRLKEFTRHYHVEDIAPSRVHEHLMPGRGAINFAEVFAAVRDTSYGGWMTVELYPYLDNPDAAGREALEYLRGILDW